MALLSPGVQVTVADKSIYTATTSNTVPLFFIATKYGKTQPNSNVLAQGTIEAGVPRLVTSLRESIELFGVPIFYRDVYDQPYHGDCRNEYGLLALNQFLKVGNRAYVIRANIDLDDDVESLQLLWEKATVDAVNIAKQLAGTELSQRNNGDTDPAKQFLGGHELFTLTSDLIDLTTGDIRLTSDSTLTAAQKANIKAYHTAVSSKEYYNDKLIKIIDIAIEEYSKSTSSFKDRYTNSANLKFNLSSVLSGNFYNYVSKDGSNPDGMKYTYFEHQDPIFSATLTGGNTSTYTSDVNVHDILLDGARTIHTQVRTSINDILANDTSKTDPFLGTKGLLESKIHPYSLGTVGVSYTTLPTSLTLPLPNGYNDVLQVTGYVKNVFVPPTDTTLPNATTKSVATVEYVVSGNRYQGTTLIGKFTGIIKDATKGLLYAAEINGNTFNFSNTDDKVFNIFYTDVLSAVTTNIGELTIAANTTSPLLGNSTSNFGGVIDITKFKNTKGGFSVAQFGSLVDTAFRDYIKTDSWYFVTHPKNALQSGSFDLSTNNTDATRRLEVVRRLAQVIQDNASLNMDVKPEFGSDIASEGYEFNIMLCPGFPEVSDELLTLADRVNQEAIVIGDVPMDLSPRDAIRWGQQVNESSIVSTGNNIRSDNRGLIAYYYPHGYTSNLDGYDVLCPSSALALSVIAYSDSIGNVWSAPAGPNRGLLSGISSVAAVGYVNTSNGAIGTAGAKFERVRLNQGMRDSLYNACNINPIHDSVQYGIAVWGQKTRVSLAFNSSLDRLNVSRMVAAIRRGVRKLAYNFLMQPNDEITRAGLTSAVTAYLHNIQVNRGLYEFAVQCDTSNNTSDMIDRNELEVKIALKPSKTVEFIYVPITLVRTGDSITQ